MQMLSPAHHIGRFVREDDGVTLMECALIAALASVVIIFVVLAFTRAKL